MELTNLNTANPMVPIDVNVIIETVAESKKSDNRVANKGKKKITGRGNHSIQKQKEVCK